MNIILSFATGYTVEKYNPLLNSLQKINFPFKFVLFTDLQQTDFIDYNFVEVINVKNELYQDIHQPVISAVLRYYFYKRYIELNDVDSSILFCDIRDVIFQNGKIFDNLNKNKIYIFKENNRYIFGEEQCHINWFNSINRQDFIQNFYKETFYCSGVQLFGNKNVCSLYLDLFINECKKYIEYKWDINDQTIHNILIYENHIDDNVLFKYESELNDKVFSMGLCKEEDYIINNKILYYISTNIIPSVIHQYDRRINRTQELL